MAGIALLGAGLFAKEAHLPALVENGINLLAVYSRSTNSAQSLVQAAAQLGASTSRIGVYSDEQQNQGLTELLQRADIKAVVVALPILVQPAVVRRCLAAGKHVLCEKPIAKDVQTAMALVSDYESNYAPKGILLSVAEQFRYDIAFTRARELVQNGRIGPLAGVHARVWGNIQPGGKWYETEWRKEPGYQGGFLLDGGVHFVALIRYVSGQEIVETTSLVKQVYAHLPPIDTVNAALRFDGGATGSLSISFASSKSAFDFLFVGTTGTVAVTGTDGGHKVIVEDVDGNVQAEEIIDGKGVSEEIKAFVQATADGYADKKAGAREALADIAVIESICAGGGIVRDRINQSSK